MRAFGKRNYVAVSAGSYPWIPLNSHAEEFNVGYAVFHNGTGQCSANLEGTYENVLAIAGSAAAFFLVTANPSTGLNTDGNITQPIMAIRYRSIVVSGSVNTTFHVMQSA